MTFLIFPLTVDAMNVEEQIFLIELEIMKSKDNEIIEKLEHKLEELQASLEPVEVEEESHEEGELIDRTFAIVLACSGFVMVFAVWVGSGGR